MGKKNKGEAVDNYSNMPAGAERREVKTTAEKVHKRNRMIRFLLAVIALLILLLGIAYLLIAFVNNVGRFTIDLDPDAFSKYNLSISETRDFKDPKGKKGGSGKGGTIRLQADPVEDMYNITKEWLLNNQKLTPDMIKYNPSKPTYNNISELDTRFDGSHNGDDYIAYTFYIRNNGEDTVTYNASLDILSTTKGADEAVRIMVFEDGKPTTYGKKTKDPDAGDEEHPANYLIEKEFISEKVAMQSVISNFKPGDIHKYTIVIWLEGWDPECVDDIMGGQMKFQMNIKVTGVDNEAA
ncbi:MAG: hypothetical protein K5756_01360 [Clostridiales bacterium]|nr:hypothetical protein [Clostridiales bacterium]